MYHSRFIILFTQITHTEKTNTKHKETILNFTVQYLENYRSPVQPLAYRGWANHVHIFESLLLEGSYAGDLLQKHKIYIYKSHKIYIYLQVTEELLITKIWNSSKCLSTGEWISKL